ncbi:MAG: hypothetical protein BroJett003_25810 [Planctomycetota bacterium]|nr:MAG: hypothetical protein BroJett003_25810 [Planctomycetota bacterium]
MRTIMTALLSVGLLLSIAGCPQQGGGGNTNTNTPPPNDNAAEEPTAFSADLSGEDEVPPVDTTVTGSAEVEFNAEGTEVTVTVTVAGAVGVTAAHIHLGAPGENGGVVLLLFANAEGLDVDGELVSATFSAEDLSGDLAGATLDDLLDEIEAGNAYVNVHTLAHSAGEVRGQLAPAE